MLLLPEIMFRDCPIKFIVLHKNVKKMYLIWADTGGRSVQKFSLKNKMRTC